METNSSTTTTTYTKQFVQFVVIMVGIPCSGKTTWAEAERKFWLHFSRDTARQLFHPGKFLLSPRQEKEVTISLDGAIDIAIEKKMNMVIDNTHVQEKYIDSLIMKFAPHDNYVVQIKVMRVNFLVALWRNIIRKKETGKWIPLKVMWRMQKNFNKINWKKYEHILL